MFEFKYWLENQEDYRGVHRAPGPGKGAPLYNIAVLYPDDIYVLPIQTAARYYGDGSDIKMDIETLNIIRSAHQLPEQKIQIWRAVSSDIAEQGVSINPGDWVTINQKYAVMHGETTLEGSYKILSKIVRAKDLYTEANNIHEYGYYPQ